MLTIREVIRTFYNALLQRLKKYRGNWEQNDPTADDYIKNRPFYTDENGKTVKFDKKYLPDLGLARVAKTGSYQDLNNKPTIYTDVVRYNSHQSLSSIYKERARTNIGAAATSHTQSAGTISSGTFTGIVYANGTSQTPGISLLRNSKLVSTETTPTNNGEIFWTYE